MFRKFIAALILAASPAAAQDFDISSSIADTGLAATETRLTADNPRTRFALGAVRFLRAIESTLQLRYRHNAQFDDLGIPVLRLPVPPNPNAEPFYPGLITDLFRALKADMSASRDVLSGIDPAAELSLEIDLADLWFDVNENATRDAGEGVFEVAASALAARPGELGLDAMPDSLVVRFDSADAAWLRAYTHLLSAIAELVIAFDPTDVIGEVLSSVARMDALRGAAPTDRFSYLRGSEFYVDMVAMAYGAINRRPNAANTVAARDHLLAMIEENREFWRLVAQETDDDREWLPNARQTAAFGFQLPPDTGTVWLKVLADAEDILTGKKLVSHWRIEPGAAINVAKLFEDPPVVDLVSWIQGYGLLDYMEKGPLADADSVQRFERMFSGDALLFMVWLN